MGRAWGVCTAGVMRHVLAAGRPILPDRTLLRSEIPAGVSRCLKSNMSTQAFLPFPAERGMASCPPWSSLQKLQESKRRSCTGQGTHKYSRAGPCVIGEGDLPRAATTVRGIGTETALSTANGLSAHAKLVPSVTPEHQHVKSRTREREVQPANARGDVPDAASSARPAC